MITCDTVIIVASGAVDCINLLKDELCNRENKYIICADGGIKHLRAVDATPDLWIGDFDSSQLLNFENCKIIKLNPIKDETDFEYVINWTMENVICKSIKIFGATGKRMDHTLSNVFTLKSFINKDVIAEIYDGYNIIRMFKGEIKAYKSDYNYLSIIPLENNNCIYAKGVKYPLSGECLNPFTSRGISNEITDDCAIISSDVPTILIMSDDERKS